MDSSQRPSAIRQLWLISAYEVSKRFTNTKGLAALIAFCLVWAVILLYPVHGASSYLLEPAAKDFAQQVLGLTTLDQVEPEFAVFWGVALYLFPFFCIFITADQFSSDKQRGSFRFLSLRVSRDSIFFGRFLGQMFIQASLLLLTVLATMLMVITRDASLFGEALISGIAIFISITIILLPYTAVMAILSLYANSARMASIYAVILWLLSGIAIAIITTQLPSISFISWVLPGSQLSLMIDTQGFNSLVYAPIPIIQALVILFFGRLYMQRSAL